MNGKVKFGEMDSLVKWPLSNLSQQTIEFVLYWVLLA